MRSAVCISFLVVTLAALCASSSYKDNCEKMETFSIGKPMAEVDKIISTILGPAIKTTVPDNFQDGITVHWYNYNAPDGPFMLAYSYNGVFFQAKLYGGKGKLPKPRRDYREPKYAHHAAFGYVLQLCQGKPNYIEVVYD